ncbi:MAG: hypothetical protein GWN62_16985 [Aliifodinibius sp.]|nr:hypothetical protein [Fodinibius sp.]
MRQIIEDRIQKPFIGTAEEDEIIYTMLDLEQYIGREITWVSGLTFDEVVKTKGGWLPNKLHRYCTHWLKLEPMFYWWAENIGKPVEMRIGFRANEQSRAISMQEKLNKNGFLEFSATFEKHKSGTNKGKNKWELIEWQKPSFPLIYDSIFKDNIQKFWKDKPVRFANQNNCVGCFHRHPILLRKKWEDQPKKMEWFAKQEGGKKNYWRGEGSYYDFKKWKLQLELDFDDFGKCDTGGCGI